MAQARDIWFFEVMGSISCDKSLLHVHVRVRVWLGFLGLTHGPTGTESQKGGAARCHFFFLFLPHHTALISFLPLTSPLLTTPFRNGNHATSLTLKNKGSSDDLGSLSLSHSLFDSFVHCLACASFITCLLVFLFLLFCVLITSFSRPNHRSPPDGHCTYLQPLRAPGHGRLVKNLGLYSLRHLVGRLGNP